MRAWFWDFKLCQLFLIAGALLLPPGPFRRGRPPPWRRALASAERLLGLAALWNTVGHAIPPEAREAALGRPALPEERPSMKMHPDASVMRPTYASIELAR